VSAALAVVIPSVGRPSLQLLLDSLAAQAPVQGVWPPAGGVVVVDDRPEPQPALHPVVDADWQPVVVTSGGRGPAAARNTGWRSLAAGADIGWVAFLDDDVILPEGWSEALAADLVACPAGVGGTQGRIVVPLPTDRPPTDWERNTAGLQDARWATADMAYRTAALTAVAGFDERFPRAYREDADLAVRVRRAGWELTTGSRSIRHPVRPADDLVSLRVQRGNADDALLRALYGSRWREIAATGPGRDGWHVATVLAAALGIGGAVSRRSAPAFVGAAAWLTLTADFARRRLVPGPRPGDPGYRDELRRMVVTSVAIPPAALWHRTRAAWRWRAGATPWAAPDSGGAR
jgi:hypothetical protein